MSNEAKIHIRVRHAECASLARKQAVSKKKQVRSTSHRVKLELLELPNQHPSLPLHNRKNGIIL